MSVPATWVANDRAGMRLGRRASKAAVFSDEKSRALLQRLERIAPTEAVVLINGETGTGKEVVARHIHDLSGRSGPFVAVNCGALAHSLAEAELFGHQAGAYTGATEARAGWFEAANGGTLLLDEVGELSLPMQVKLLRVLQEGEVVRLGARRPVPLNVRLIAATNVDLARAVGSGAFRLDLYYRLNVVNVSLLPLRERRGDIPALAEHFVRHFATQMQLPAMPLLPEACRVLANHAWPGNVRELENVLQVALLTANGNGIAAEDLRFPVTPLQSADRSSDPLEEIAAQLDRLFAAPPIGLQSRLEELIVARAFAHCASNQVRTAKLLGVSRNILRSSLKRLGLLAEKELPSFDPLVT